MNNYRTIGNTKPREHYTKYKNLYKVYSRALSLSLCPTRLLSLSNFGEKKKKKQEKDDVNCTQSTKNNQPQSPRSAPTVVEDKQEKNHTRSTCARTTANKKYTNNPQVDDEIIKQVNNTTENKHNNLLRNIEKKRISAENKEIVQNYNDLEQIQQKIAVLSKQIKTILRMCNKGETGS